MKSLLSKLALSMADYTLEPVAIKLLRPRAKAQSTPSSEKYEDDFFAVLASWPSGP